MQKFNPAKTKIIACATVMEEVAPFMPAVMRSQEVEFGLHTNPDKLRNSLQDIINQTESGIETIILGYGLCSRAVVGLSAQSQTLVVPKIDDCIGIFLGSAQSYTAQNKSNPGTYYLTKGWINTGSTIFDQYPDISAKYGEEAARRIVALTLRHYTRLAYIQTGPGDEGAYRLKARQTAQRFALEFDEIRGSDILIKKMLSGEWENDFVIAPPGRKLSFLDFR